MKPHREEMLKSFKHSNKEYEKKTKEILSKMFNEEEKIENEFYNQNPNYTPKELDGGCTKAIRENLKKHFKMIEKLKTELNITDK